MMDYYSAIASGFQETIELISNSVDQLAEPIQRASELCSHTLLQERKILCCGNGQGNAVAQLFSANLLHHFEQERPALPAVSLGTDSTVVTALAFSAANELYSRQVRALGQPGDLLLGVATGEGDASIIQAIRAAHEREMSVIILSGENSADISSLLLPEDVLLYIASSHNPRIVEMQTMIIHCLCQLIEKSLFGTYES